MILLLTLASILTSQPIDTIDVHFEADKSLTAIYRANHQQTVCTHVNPLSLTGSQVTMTAGSCWDEILWSDFQ